MPESDNAIFAGIIQMTDKPGGRVTLCVPGSEVDCHRRAADCPFYQSHNRVDNRFEMVFPMRVEYEDHVCHHAAAGAIQGT
jgi:hypothetical protein